MSQSKVGVLFSDERVRAIKRALINGADPVMLARYERCSANTIRRIRDGETYNHVYVDGEDALRPPLRLPDGYSPEGPRTREEAKHVGVDPLKDEDADALLERMLQTQEEVKGGAALPPVVNPFVDKE